MAEEIIGTWDEASELVLDLNLRSASDPISLLPTGLKIDPPDDSDRIRERRCYKLVDGDGNEVKYPLTLISDTRIVV